ncbi:MAG: MMPL family transporter [Desulfatibacillum sp.]|nr:MMPL family transporter [Desulfatibacillum sp.]
MPSQIPQGRFLRILLTSALKWPWATILFFCAITLFFAWHIPQLGFRTSIYDLAVEDLPGTKYYEKFKKDFGSEEVLLVVVRGDNIFSQKTFRSLEIISGDLSSLPGVRRIISLPGIRKDMDLTEQWTNADFERIIEPVALFDRNFLSPDKTATVISLLLHADTDRKGIIEAVDGVINKDYEGVRSIYQIGMPSVAQALATYTEKDFALLPPITFGIILLVLFALFGNLRGVVLPSIAVVMSLVWTMGLMAYTHTALSLMTMIVPVFLIAVGTAYCMHIISEYKNSSQERALPREAVYLCFSRVGFPSSLAVTTTVVGLASLLVNRIEGIREFAVFSCFGMVSLLAIILLFLPAVMSMLPLSKSDSRGFVTPWVGKILEGVIALNLVHRKKVLPVLGVITLVAVAGIFFVRVETNPVDYFKKSTEISKNFYDIYKDMAGSFPVNVVLDSKKDSYFEDPSNLAKLAAIQEHMTLFDGVDKTVAFTDFLKMVNYATNDFDPVYYTLPLHSYEIRMLTNTYKSMLGQDMYSRFMDPGMSKANIMLRTHVSSSRDFFTLRDNISQYLEANFMGDLNYQVTGLGMVISESSHILTSSQVKSLSITMLVIFGIMLLLFLSGKVGLVAIATNIFPIILCFGFMGWFGIKLSVVTSLIASIAIGLAVDDTIHYLVRYNREFRRDLDKDRALRDTLRSVGPPIIFTTITISLGFSVLLFSHFQPTSVFGMLMVITMIAALVGDLIFLPAVMLHVELVTAWDLMSLIPSLGGISPGVAHELRQPLNAMKLGSEYVRTLLEKGEAVPREDLAEVMSQIDTQIGRASNYVDRLAALGRKPTGVFEQLSLNGPVHDTLALVGKQLSLEDIEIRLDLASNLPAIMGHRNRLGQVIYNLLTNGVEAINKKSRIGADQERCIKIATYATEGRVILTVSDTGAGIRDHVKDRIMEPFFTTKQKGQGLGLGLSISREIVRDYRGKLDFESTPGKGSTFRISFPRADQCS